MGPLQKIIGPNFPITNNEPNILTENLDKQITHDRVIKLNTILDTFISFSFGLEPKSDCGLRRIHHLSYLWGKFVNCHIPRNYKAFEYTSIENTIAVFLYLDKGTITVKCNLSDTFWYIPITPTTWCFFGFFLNNIYGYNRFLLFGLYTTLYIFNFFAKRLY